MISIKDWILANLDILPAQFSAREVADATGSTLETAQYNIREMVQDTQLIEAQDGSGNRKYRAPIKRPNWIPRCSLAQFRSGPNEWALAQRLAHGN